jgi:hypothetical protein
MSNDGQTINRRRFVAGGLVAGAAAAWPAAADAATRKHEPKPKHERARKGKGHKADVVVVGAGFVLERIHGRRRPLGRAGSR